MAYITKCKGIGCKKKHKCYRYTAISHPYWQTYMEWYKDGQDICVGYMSNGGFLSPSYIRRRRINGDKRRAVSKKRNMS